MSERDVIVSEPIFCAIFCDDIREEVTGKTTIVGAFGTDLQVRQFPAFIPKLGMFLRCMLPLESDSDLSIRIEINDHILLESTFPTVDPDMQKRVRSETQDAPTRRLVDLKMVMPPLPFDGACTLRAVVEFGGKTFQAGKLHLSLRSDLVEPDC